MPTFYLILIICAVFILFALISSICLVAYTKKNKQVQDNEENIKVETENKENKVVMIPKKEYDSYVQWKDLANRVRKKAAATIKETGDKSVTKDVQLRIRYTRKGDKK